MNMTEPLCKCRCCLTVDVGMKNMFVEIFQCDEKIDQEHPSIKIIDGFTICSGLEITDDKTTPNGAVIFICYACEFQLKNAFLFRKMCHQSDDRLKNEAPFESVIKAESYDTKYVIQSIIEDHTEMETGFDDGHFSSDDDMPLNSSMTIGGMNTVEQFEEVNFDIIIDGKSGKTYKRPNPNTSSTPRKRKQNLDQRSPRKRKVSLSSIDVTDEKEIAIVDFKNSEDELEMEVEMLEEYVEDNSKSESLGKNKAMQKAYADDEIDADEDDQPTGEDRDEVMDVEAEFYCYVCLQYFKTYRIFVEHRKDHEEMLRTRECVFCKLTVSGYTKHLWQAHPEFKPYKCILCEFTAARAISLKRHLYGHTDTRLYKCLSCNTAFKNASQLRCHTTSARHSNNGFNCPYCGLAYKKMAAYAEHFRSKHGDIKAKLVPCYHCKRVFHLKRTYEEHLETCEKNMAKKGDGATLANIKCELCDETCLNQDHLLCHQMAHHSELKETLTCIECDKTFPNTVTYKRHLLIHSEKNYQCDQCGLCLNSATRLKKHQLSHTDVRNVKCDVCEATFKHRSNLKTHMRTHQPKSKTNECNECARRFTTIGQLKLHMAIHFEELKVHACELCERRFVRSVDKTKHMLTHRGERNFKCVECNKSYFTQFALKDHTLRVHAEFRFECKFCGKKYARNKSLYEHIFTHKGIKPHTCPACQAPYVKKELFKKHMRKRHGIQYSEELHGYCETFQEVLMFGLKTDGDPTVNVPQDQQEEDSSHQDTKMDEADVKLQVLHEINEGVVLQYEDLEINGQHTVTEVVVASYHEG